MDIDTHRASCLPFKNGYYFTDDYPDDQSSRMFFDEILHRSEDILNANTSPEGGN